MNLEPIFPGHIISADQFLSKNLLQLIFDETREFERMAEEKRIPKTMEGRLMVTLFYEPSTRTRISFEIAANKLGGSVVSTENAGEFSSVTKGETLEDTIRVLSEYGPDVIVLRHPEVGAAKRAADVSSVSIINAGDGHGEHPTQMLLDLYTIYRCLGRLGNLKIAFVGDLRYGRTVHSLIYPLACNSICPNACVYAVSLPECTLPHEYKNVLSGGGVRFEEVGSIEEIASEIDVWYVTRTQKERFGSEEIRKKLVSPFIVGENIKPLIKTGSVIMHPLPRLDEVPTEMDKYNNAVYFFQARCGLYVRMAILKLLLSPFCR